MTISRRGFLKGLLGGAAIIAAPAIVRSESLMKIWTPKQGLVYPGSYFGDMVWKPEVRLITPTAIDKSELIVQPMHKHVANLPIFIRSQFGPSQPPRIVGLEDYWRGNHDY